MVQAYQARLSADVLRALKGARRAEGPGEDAVEDLRTPGLPALSKSAQAQTFTSVKAEALILLWLCAVLEKGQWEAYVTAVVPPGGR
jgi:hypothetical protein